MWETWGGQEVRGCSQDLGLLWGCGGRHSWHPVFIFSHPRWTTYGAQSRQSLQNSFCIKWEPGERFLHPLCNAQKLLYKEHWSMMALLQRSATSNNVWDTILWINSVSYDWTASSEKDYEGSSSAQASVGVSSLQKGHDYLLFHLTAVLRMSMKTKVYRYNSC